MTQENDRLREITKLMVHAICPGPIDWDKLEAVGSFQKMMILTMKMMNRPSIIDQIMPAEEIPCETKK
jgi:hypothetical protein